mgnify:FL=1
MRMDHQRNTVDLTNLKKMKVERTKNNPLLKVKSLIILKVKNDPTGKEEERLVEDIERKNNNYFVCSAIYLSNVF